MAEKVMTEDQIRAECEALAAALMDRGFKGVDVYCQIRVVGRDYTYIGWDTGHLSMSDGQGFWEGTLPERLQAAWDWVNEQPTKQQRLEKVAIASTAAALEAVREAGLEPEFINPLEVMMKKLSENAITDQGPQDGDT